MTAVSKAHPAIKKVITAITSADAPGTKWSGRKIFVEEVSPSWEYHLYNDTGEPRVYRVVLGKHTTARRIPTPSYGGPSTVITAPSGGEAVVTRQIGATGQIYIYVPRFDSAVLEIARDAVLSRKDERVITDQLGPYGGIASAVAASEGKTLQAAESGKTPSRQLQREIDEFLFDKRRGLR